MNKLGRIERELTEVLSNPCGSENLTRLCLARIRANDERLRCMVYMDEDAALELARDLDRKLRAGAPPGPLHGLPIIVKEIFSVDGMPESAGSKIPLSRPLGREGPFIERLRAAGCIIIGKSLSTEFAFGQYNLNKAMPVNPADPFADRVTGGSSSGSAGAQAARYCSFAVGTDTGGSVRAPAAMCGVAGFMPSAGVWPMGGVFQLSRRFDSPGIITDTVGDALRVYEALTDSARPEFLSLENCRIAIPERQFFSDVDDAVRGAMDDTLQRISAAGVELLPFDLPDMSQVQRYFAEYLPQQLRAQIGEAILDSHWDELDELTQRRLLTPRPELHEAEAYKDLQRLRRSFDEAMQKIGATLWVLPTVPCVAPLMSSLASVGEVADWQSYVSRNTRCVNALEISACTIPVAGEEAGRLPVGLQLAGSSDMEVLSVAAALESIIGQTS